MNLSSKLILNFKEDTDLYYNLLIEEDFNFKTKNIKIDIFKKNGEININFNGNSIINLKIASNAIIKSLEIIDKTLKV